MALAITLKGSNRTDYGTSFTISSFTSTADSLLVISFYNAAVGSGITVTGHGTWTTIDESANHHIYAVLTGAGSTSSIVISNVGAGNNILNMSCVEVTGGDVTSIANAIPQSIVGSGYNASGQPFTNSTTLAAFGSASNATMVWGCGGVGTYSTDTGYTSLYTATGHVTGSILSADTSPSFISASEFLGYSIAAIELAEASGGSATVTGTATASITESDIVTGGKTIILTLTGDTFIAAGTGPIGSTANTQSLIDGIDSAQAEATGWDAVVKVGIETTDVVRTSNTVATITLDAEASYNITATETITVTIPAAVLTGAAQIVATPTFTITATGLAIPIAMYHYMHSLRK